MITSSEQGHSQTGTLSLGSTYPELPMQNSVSSYSQKAIKLHHTKVNTAHTVMLKNNFPDLPQKSVKVYYCKIQF